MGTIILFVFLSILFAFLLGMVFTEMRENNENITLNWFAFLILIFVLTLGLSVAAIQDYYEKKEYSSTKYELKKKVITIEEDNTIKLDTVYTFMRK